MRLNSFTYFSINHGFYRGAIELLNIYGVLYVYRLFDNSVEASILILSGNYFAYPIVLVFVADFISKIGARVSMLIGVFLQIISFIPMYMFYTKEWYWFFLVMLLTGLAKVFYYIPFESYSVKLTQNSHRGSDMGFLNAFKILVMIVTPFIGGIAMEMYGFFGMLVICFVYLFISSLALFRVEDYRFKISKNVFKIFKDKAMRKLLAIRGIDEMQGRLRFWEIHVFMLIGMSYSEFGYISTIVYIITIPILLMVGKFSNNHNKKILLHINGFINSIIWFARVVINQIFGIIIVNSIDQINSSLKKQTIDIITYDMNYKDHQENLVDEKAFILEFSINIFLGVSLILGAIIYNLFGMEAVFIQAGLTSLLFYFI